MDIYRSFLFYCSYLYAYKVFDLQRWTK